MKKIMLVLIVLLAVGTFAVAQEVLTPTITGSATVTWGVDLGTSATGFTNSFTSSIDVPLIAAASDSKTGDAVYGYISLASFSALIDEDGGLTVTEPSITAKLLLAPGADLTIYAAPGFSFGNAAGFAYIDATAARNIVAPAIAGTTGGVTFNYAADMFSVAVKLASHGNWDTVAGAAATTATYGWMDDMGTTADLTDDVALDGTAAATGTPYWAETSAAVAAGDATSNEDNNYSAGLTFTLDPVALLSLSGGVLYGPLSEGTLAATVKVTITPASIFSAWVGFDASKAAGDATVLAYDLAAGLSLTLDAINAGVHIYYDGITDAADLEVRTNIGVTAVENLTLTAVIDLYTLMNTMDFAAQVDVAYDIDGIKPYAGVKYYADPDAASMSLNAGVTLTGMVENTVFKVDYASADLMSDPADSGDLELSATISY